MRKLAAGNWKMNGTSQNLSELQVLASACTDPKSDILICPPASLVHRAARTVHGTPIAIGGQDCHSEASGAFTGDISAEMLADAGATHVILGHSERRTLHGESDRNVHDKACRALDTGLTAIICVGESLDDRNAGKTLPVISAQLAGSVPDRISPGSVVIAYEPIWAIGTGKVATLEQIGEVHDAIRSQLETRFGPSSGGAVRILYGGSVKPDNAAAIFGVPNVDGALVGGASLRAADFSPIIDALDASGPG